MSFRPVVFGLAALAMAEAAGATEPLVIDAARAERHYVLHCSGCHGADGHGTPDATPSLHGLDALARTEAGRRYLMRVPGVAQAPLADSDLAALLTWVVGRFAGEGGASPDGTDFSAEEVGRFRDEPLRDPLVARRALAAERP